MNKKGSMQLGINAIVVLIIALAILGLGMSFITKLFGSSSEKFSNIIDSSELPFHADSGNPLVFESTDVTVKAGKETKLKAAVYNLLGGKAEVIIGDTEGELFTCEGDDEGEISMLSGIQEISSGEEVGFALIIKAKDSVETGTYICTVKASLENLENSDSNDLVSRQIFVNVVR